MQTYSHFLMTVLLNDGLKSRGIPVHTKALLLGSFMPDVPLFALSLGYLVYRSWCGPLSPEDQICGPRFNTLYFHNPFWIVSHNLFHAPLHLILMAIIGYRLRRQKLWGLALFWFAVACGLHSLVDIFTHYDDGPLPLFPFNWEYRFQAPVSYWDRRHGARIFAPLEHLLDLMIVIYFGVTWLKRRRSLKTRETN